MQIRNRHQRLVTAGPERVAALLADLGGIWPTDIAPAPRALGCRRYDAGLMVWQEVDRPGAARAFRVVDPHGLQAEHWFELEPAESGTLLRHTVEGEAVGAFAALWRDRIEPLHDRVLEALLDNVEASARGRAATLSALRRAAGRVRAEAARGPTAGRGGGACRG